MSRTDHLASGLVPLALLALGAWVYPRVRAGLAALVSIATGIFGVIIGAIEPVYYTTAVGPSGDDFTGCWRSPRAWCWSGWARSVSGDPGGRPRSAGGATSDGCCCRW